MTDPTQAPLTAKGRNAIVQFDGRMLTIRKIGSGQGGKSIPVRHIAGVQMKKADWLTSGHIAFTLTGESDPDTVVFGKGQADEFQDLHAAVMAALASL